jgi:hypothetical protein
MPIFDYDSPATLDHHARAVQRALAAALPPELRTLPRWKLAQDKHIPTLEEIQSGLIHGRYQEIQT